MKSDIITCKKKKKKKEEEKEDEEERELHGIPDLCGRKTNKNL